MKKRKYNPSLKRLEAILEDWQIEKKTNRHGLDHLADSAIAHFSAEIEKKKQQQASP